MDTPTLQLAELVASVFTAIGVLVALFQIQQARRESRTAFEDQMAREFRDTIHLLPARVVLGATLSDAEHEEHFDEIYRYIDLTNEQTFLRSVGRISDKTWAYWVAGIQELLGLPEFKRVWDEVRQQAKGRFRELRRLESEGFDIDPRRWQT
jgi:hypothetical protein